MYMKGSDTCAAQTLDYRIPSYYTRSLRMSRLAMRTTDVGRSGTSSFLHGVYARDMAQSRLPEQVKQLVDVTSVTITEETENAPLSCRKYHVKACDGSIQFAVTKVLPDSDHSEQGGTWGRNNILWYRDIITVKINQTHAQYMAEVHSPSGNIIGYIDRTDIGIRLLNANENVVFRLKKERYKKAVLKCLRRSLSQQFAIQDEQHNGRFGSIHYKTNNQIKIQFGSDLKQVERVLLIGVCITLAGEEG